MAEVVLDDFDDVALVVVEGFLDDLLVAGGVLVVDQVLGSRGGIERQVEVGVGLVQGADADAGGVVVVGDLLVLAESAA